MFISFLLFLCSTNNPTHNNNHKKYLHPSRFRVSVCLRAWTNRQVTFQSATASFCARRWCCSALTASAGGTSRTRWSPNIRTSTRIRFHVSSGGVSVDYGMRIAFKQYLWYKYTLWIVFLSLPALSECSYASYKVCSFHSHRNCDCFPTITHNPIGLQANPQTIRNYAPRLCKCHKILAHCILPTCFAPHAALLQIVCVFWVWFGCVLQNPMPIGRVHLNSLAWPPFCPSRTYRHHATGTLRRGERPQLLLRHARRDDGGDRGQRVPGVRHARRGDVRHQAGHDPAHSQRGQNGHTGRRAASTEDTAHQRVHTVRGVHCGAVAEQHCRREYSMGSSILTIHTTLHPTTWAKFACTRRVYQCTCVCAFVCLSAMRISQLEFSQYRIRVSALDGWTLHELQKCPFVSSASSRWC